MNAIEVLEARFANREYPPYHSIEWRNMMWAKYAWQRSALCPAREPGYEVTPPSGKEPQ